MWISPFGYFHCISCIIHYNTNDTYVKFLSFISKGRCRSLGYESRKGAVLPFGIRTLWTAAVCGDSREVRFHLSIYCRYRPIMAYDAKRTVWFRKNASMPCRADQGFVEAFADTKSCYGLLGMPGIIAFCREHAALLAHSLTLGRFHALSLSSPADFSQDS